MAFFASPYVYKERLAVCKTCDFYAKAAHMCKDCGCFMPAKAKIAKLRCPKDKWIEVYGTEDREPDTILSEESSEIAADQKKKNIENVITYLKKEIINLEDELNDSE
jgi:hypothetical protein